MKDIFTILSENSVTVPDEVKQAVSAAVNENYKTVAEVSKITTARDNYKSQLEKAQNALKEFEGVDVKELQGKITSLTNDLTKKENDYQAKLADLEFSCVLDAALTASGAKNANAVKALLDLDALKTSKNQADDIQKALESVKKENDFLFPSEEPVKNPVRDTGNSYLTGDTFDMIRTAMGLPTTKSFLNQREIFRFLIPPMVLTLHSAEK